MVGERSAMQNLTHVWQEVSIWPPEQRLALAQRLLQSLQPEAATLSKERQDALLQLIGIWKTEHPPDDEQIEQILEYERMKKYG
jgi:hypothetical protein